MSNFLENIKAGVLKDGIETLKSIVDRLNSYDEKSHCRCEECNKFIDFLVDCNKKRNLHKFELSNSLSSRTFFILDSKFIDIKSLYKSDNLFKETLNRFVILNRHDDWYCFGSIFYCEDCFSFYDITNCYENDEEDNSSFISSCIINVLTNFEEIKDELCYLFIYESLLKLGEVYNNLELKENVYVYKRLEYDLGLDPLWTFETEESKTEYIKSDIYYKNFNFNLDNSMYLNISNSSKWISSGFCRLTIDEKDLIFDINSISSGLSGFIDGFSINILKDDVKNFEFYDAVNDNWVAFNDDNLDDLIKNNKEFFSINENRDNDRFCFSNKEKNIISCLYDFYNKNINNL